MRVLLSCIECLKTMGKPNITRTEYNDNGVFCFVCTEGHHSVLILQQSRYEILFEIACNAINDGYYREAVSSYAASLERFYEYAIRVMLKQATVAPEVVDACWREVSNQSERQLGAFMFLWATCFGELPVVLKDKWRKFRNEVVHKGAIPSKIEAIDFGEEIFKMISPLQARISEEMKDSCLKVVSENLTKLRPANYTGNIGTNSIGGFLGRTTANKDLRTYLSELQHLEAVWRKLGRIIGEEA